MSGTLDGSKGDRSLFASHVAGGVVGGSLSGGLFQARPFAGMLLFTPIMVTVAFAEIQFVQLKRDRISNQQLKCNDK